MEYVVCSVICLALGAFVMALIAVVSGSEELDKVYRQGYIAGYKHAWTQVRKFNRGKYY